MWSSFQARRKLTCLTLPQGAASARGSDESLRGAALIFRNARLFLPGHGCGLGETHHETSQKPQVCASFSISPGTGTESCHHSTAKHVVKVESLEVRCEPGEHTAAGLEQGIVKTGPPLRLRGAVGLQNLLRQTPNWSSHRSTADSDCQNLLCAALQHSVCKAPSERQCDILCPPVSLRLVRFSTQPTVP